MKKKTNTSEVSLNDDQRRLVEKNIQLALNMGLRYAGLGSVKGIPVEDLQSEAREGLCIAATKYREDGGAEFSTYAFDWCRKYVLMAIMHEKPTVDHDINRLADRLPDEEYDAEYDADEDNATTDMMNSVFGCLNKQERNVVRRVWGIGCKEQNFKQIAAAMHVKPARVHQIYECALAKMEEVGLMELKRLKALGYRLEIRVK